MKALIDFILGIIAVIFPTILKESKKPKEVETLTNDKEISDDIHATIEDKLKESSDPADDVDEIGVPKP